MDTNCFSHQRRLIAFLPAIAIGFLLPAVRAEISVAQVASDRPGAFLVGWSSARVDNTTMAGPTDDSGNTQSEVTSAGGDVVTGSKAGKTKLAIAPHPTSSRRAALIWEFAAADTASLVATSVFGSQPADSKRHGDLVTATMHERAVSSAAAANACDLNGDGVVNQVDTQLAVSMSLGLASCTANIDGSGVCNAVIVQRVANAANGSPCLTLNSHSVALSWTASSSANVAGYNIYRGVSSGGPYSILNSSLVSGTSFTDDSVLSGNTYYYVSTAVDSSNDESSYSNEAKAVIPNP